MESLLRDALVNDALNKDIAFDQMRTIYDVDKTPFDDRTAKAFCAFLLGKTGLMSESSLNPRLLPKAKAALGLITFLLGQDEQFQQAFEAYSPSQLKSRLKFDRHLAEGPEEHRKTVYQLIYIMSTRFKKFSDWEDYVRAGDREAVRAGLDAIKSSGDIPKVYIPAESTLPPPGQYHDQSWEKVEDIFETDVKKGLTAEEAELRRQRYGINALPRPQPPSAMKILLLQLSDFMVIILCVVTLLEVGVNVFDICTGKKTDIADWIAIIVLFLVIFFNVVTGFVQEMKAQKALEALESLQVPKASVLRDGEAENIDGPDLVPGDIVTLDEGCQVPADLRLVEAINLDVMEAVLTGESEAVTKISSTLTVKNPALGDIKNMCFMGTSVMRGRGVGIVTATGKSTEVGKISKEMAKQEDTQTLLQKRLRGLGKVLVAIAVVLTVVVVIITLIRLGVNGHLGGDEIFEALETGISLGVSVIPEGLVAVTTITMALGVQRMAKNNAVVKRLAVVESLGSITVICSDKTGTLTEGKMKAEELSVCGSVYHFSGSGATPEGELLDKNDSQVTQDHYSEALQKTLMTCALCNNASIVFHDDLGKYVPVGDPTEVAILVAAEKGKMNKAFWLGQGWSFVDEVPFDSDRKCMSVLYTTKKTESGSSTTAVGTESSDDEEEDTAKVSATHTDCQSILLAKGAPESIIKKCARRMKKGSKDGKVGKLHESDMKELEEEALEMASRGLRVLALAYKPMNPDEYVKGAGKELSEYENDLIYLGLIGLIDPPRLEVRGAIRDCRAAGINVVMITGDHPLTATAIAKQLGILRDTTMGVVSSEEEDSIGIDVDETEEYSDDKFVMKGADLDAYTEDDLDLLRDMEPFPRVFARVNPHHKLMIVEALKERGEIVAMTGDGVNDAPAIKKASVGVAMGLTGTDLTKDAAAMILLDDNFGTIVTAIAEGRHIYDNIKKFCLYLLSCNSAEVYTMLLCGIIGLPVPFSAIMILWVNLVADLPPALALGVDPQESDVMIRKPRNPQDNIFNGRTIILLLYQGFSIALWAVLCYGLTLFYQYPDSLKLAYGGVIYKTASDSLDDPSSMASGSVVDSSAMDSAKEDLITSQTLCLNVVTFIQLIHAPLSRSVRNSVFTKTIFNNYWLNGGVLLSAVLMVLGVYVPGVNHVLGQNPLPGLDWVKILLSCVLHTACVEIYKLVLRKKARKRHFGKWYDDV